MSLKPGTSGRAVGWFDAPTWRCAESRRAADARALLSHVPHGFAAAHEGSVSDVYWDVLTFVETKLFSKLVREYLPDDAYSALQQALIANPESGDLVRGSGGVRKLRWNVAGRGKRGGIRVIYYLRLNHGEIWMLTVYAKNVVESIPPSVLRKIREEIDG